jgi:hypothetical protein
MLSNKLDEKRCPLQRILLCLEILEFDAKGKLSEFLKRANISRPRKNTFKKGRASD